MKDFESLSIQAHRKTNGKLEVRSTFPVTNKEELSIAYSPGVAGPCKLIQQNPDEFTNLVSAGKTVAVISDGSAVLGLGNIGPKAAMPVMEGKSVLFKRFAGINSFPLVIGTQDVEEFVNAVKLIAPSFGGINLEDISAPRCFDIEAKLKQELDIPVFHDDQHGTAIVVLAAIINYLKLARKSKDVKVVINGSGAAGVAIAKLLLSYGIDNIVVCDSKGILSSSREGLNNSKQSLVTITNLLDEEGSVYDAMVGADIFVGVSKGDLLQEEHIKSMAKDPAVFALANPIPEIHPDKAKNAGALVVGTGRSDFDNQINNVLVFPGIFKGALQAGASAITEQMKLAAAERLANIVTDLSVDKIIPSPFEEGVADQIAQAVRDAGM